MSAEAEEVARRARSEMADYDSLPPEVRRLIWETGMDGAMLSEAACMCRTPGGKAFWLDFLRRFLDEHPDFETYDITPRRRVK